MTAKTLALLEVRSAGQRIAHLICEAPDVWVFRPVDEPASALPSWSALARPALQSVNRRAWFRHLLPEAPYCAQLARRLGVSTGNEFALLGLAGGDCRGALSFARPGAAPASTPTPRVADAALLRDFAAALPTGDAISGQAGLDYLLPGEPGQFPCDLSDGRVVLDARRDWVARVGRPGLDEAVENETLCRRLALALGLPCASLEYLGAPVPLLVLRRIECGDSASPTRRHLEDFGQLAGLYPEQAFEREGGLAVLDCANLIRRYSAAPALDLRVLLGWVTLSFLAGFGSAHARCLAFLETARGPRLTVCDGLLSTHVYPQTNERMAMYVGREDRPDWIHLARWRELAEELGVGARYLIELVRQTAGRLPALAVAATQGLGTPGSTLKVVPRILKLIENRARQTQIALAAESH